MDSSNLQGQKSPPLGKIESTHVKRVLITQATSKGSGEPAQLHSLIRAFAVRLCNMGNLRRFQTKIRISGPIESQTAPSYSPFSCVMAQSLLSSESDSSLTLSLSSSSFSDADFLLSANSSSYTPDGLTINSGYSLRCSISILYSYLAR